MTEFQPRKLDDVVREHVCAMLKHFKGDKSKTAASLGVSVRSIQHWLNRWSLTDEYSWGKYPK